MGRAFSAALKEDKAEQDMVEADMDAAGMVGREEMEA